MNWKAMWTRLQDLLSRKFIVFVIASVAMFMKLIDGWVWAGVAGAYLGINLLQKKLVEKDPLNVG
jgi:hypothetical protein